MTRSSNTLKRIGISFLAIIIMVAFSVPGFGNVSYAASSSSEVSSGNNYYTVPTVAIKSVSNGKYLAVDTSYGYDSSDLIIKNTSVKEENKFELLTAASGSSGSEVIMRSNAVQNSTSITSSRSIMAGYYSLMSSVTKRMISRDYDINNHNMFHFSANYMVDGSYLTFLDKNYNILYDVPYNDQFYIAWYNSDSSDINYVGIDKLTRRPKYFPNEPDKAELFTMEMLYTNKYTREELNILENDEWFNIDDKYVGYWDIQSEIGDGKVYSLKTLGYTILKHEDQTEDAIVLKPWATSAGPLNMTFAVGAKKVNKGSSTFYDIIIACQGTGGYPDYPDNRLVDCFTNIVNDLDGNFHKGYKEGALSLLKEQSNIYGIIDGYRLSLGSLINEAKHGNAHITILGHSMGGAIAQYLGYYLAHKYNIPASEITGRTFEAALFSSKSYPLFYDWVNICVNTDGVSNGTVTGAILQKAGIHRLGKTITLYDTQPNLDNSTNIVGISEPKHNMDRTLLTLMKSFYGDETDDVIKEGIDGTWITVDDNLESNNGPYASSGPATQFPEMGTEVNVVGYKVNSYGNRWYLLSDNSWMYGGNIQKVTTFPKADNNFYVSSNSAPIRKAYYQEAKVLKTLSKGDTATVDMSAFNSRGNVWYHVKSGKTTGWVWSNHLVPFNLDLVDNYKKITVCCPVDVDVMAPDGTPIVMIKNDEIKLSNDETKVVPVVDDDQKTLYILGEDDYQIKVSSRDYGELAYIVESDYDEEAGEYNSREIFEYVELIPDKVLGSKENASKPVEDSTLYVIDPETNNTVSEVDAWGEETETGSEVFFKYSSIKKATVTKIKDRAYTGKAIKPAPIVKFKGRKLVKGTDYTVTYKNNTKIGKAKVIIKGKGLFTGSVTKYFKINPAKVKGLKLTSPKSKQLKVAYTKGKGGVKYQIAYRLKGKSTWKKVTTTGTSKTFKKLKGGKYYQVKVRAYKKVNGTTYYGAWTAIKSLKAKK